MCEEDGPQGRLRCWNLRTRKWRWINSLHDYGIESMVMGCDVWRGRCAVISATLPLHDKSLLIEGSSGRLLHELSIHNSGGLIHRTDFAPGGQSFMTTDRHGFCEYWDIGGKPNLGVRVALPVGAVMAYCNLGSSFVLATEGGRIMKFELHDCPRD
jgi:WD40 repeat protein